MMDESMTILVVEEEPQLRNSLVTLLQQDGHRVEVADDGPTALQQGSARSYDLVLLDPEMLRMPGRDFCKILRRARPSVSILMLTPDGTTNGSTVGERGADDYVPMPVRQSELLTRVHELRERSKVNGPDFVDVAHGRIDFEHARIEVGADETPLTKREVGILRWLHRHRDRPVSRAELLENVWGVPGDLQTRTVDMTISNLRHKIESDPSQPQVVVTVKGVGYAWGTSPEL
jgi:two-component system response regulator RegX3